MTAQDRIKKVLAVLNMNNGRFCGITFKKKNGEERKMRFVYSRKKVENNRFKFNPFQKGLLGVLEILHTGGQFRFINFNAPVTLRAGGMTFTF